MLAPKPNGPQILDLVRQKETVLRDACLTATEFQRPGIHYGIPVPATEAKHLQSTSRFVPWCAKTLFKNGFSGHHNIHASSLLESIWSF